MKTIVFTSVLFLSHFSFGQVEFSQFWNTRTQINPAFQVMNNRHYANAYHRNIWPSLSGTHTANTVSYGAFVDKLKGGIGFYFNNASWSDEIKSNSIKLAYNYQMDLGENTRLSFGTGIGAIFSAYTPNWDTQFNPTFGNTFGLDFGFAIKWKKLEAGLGFQNILKSNDVARITAGEKQLNLTAQYAFGKEKGFQFFPQVMLRSAIKESGEGERYIDNTYLLANGKLGYKNKFFLGAGIAYERFAMFSAEVFLWEKIRFVYSYQHTTSPLSIVSAGSHELGVSMELGKR